MRVWSNGNLIDKEHAVAPDGILFDLEDRRIVRFEYNAERNAVLVTERCDDYFGAELTLAEFDQMIAEMQAIRNGNPPQRKS